MTGPRCLRVPVPVLAVVALWAGLPAGAAGQGSAATDRAVLETLYDATGGAGWTDSANWRTSAPLGEWHGVTTGPDGRVTRLVLRGNGLTGRIPAALGDLARLQDLQLGERYDAAAGHWVGNALTGPIPSALGRLANLERLSLGRSGLTGPIPGALGNLGRLRLLELHENALTGRVPEEFGNLANLETLGLSTNPLTGPLPLTLVRLSRLRDLDIWTTAACAPADAAFQEWLAGIRFSGETCNRAPEPVGAIPPRALAESGPALGVSMQPWFHDPDGDALTYAAASSHEGAVSAFASGGAVWLVPAAAGRARVTVTARDPGGLSATQTIVVTTAPSAGPQSDREVLEVLYESTGGASWANRANWKSSAPLGEWYGVTTDAAGRVTRLELRDNGLAGPIPAALGDLAYLEVLDMASRSVGLTGPIPDELGRLSNLESLDLTGNALTGRIPAVFGSLTSLRRLKLSRNDLTGPMPEELGHLASLETLGLSFNALTGSIPAALGNLTSLGGLQLQRNDLSGPIPDELGHLGNLFALDLSFNALTGSIPAALGNVSRLQWMDVGSNDLTGPVPDELGRSGNLKYLYLSHNWGLTGPLPTNLLATLDDLDILVTQACAPAGWRARLAAIQFEGRLCETGPDVTVDVAVVHTPAAREAAGGAAAVAAVVDLMVAETNHAYAASGVRHRVRLVERSEVAYEEAGDSHVDLSRLVSPSDGYMDEVHGLRDRVGADLVHLIVGRANVGGTAHLSGAFGLTFMHAGGLTFAHELGHNMALLHDRYRVHHHERGVGSHPAYGYVNERTVVAGVPRPRGWRTIMAYEAQCLAAYTRCPELLRFSNARQSYNGDPLGVAHGAGGSALTGPADATAVLNVTGPAVALWRDPPGANRPPAAVGTLPDRRLDPGRSLEVDLSQAFADPDGDALSYTVSSSAPRVVTVGAAGARVSLTALSTGTATMRVTATDPGGLSAMLSFAVTVTAPFTDDPLRPGETPIKAVHFRELRTRIDALRVAAGLARFPWTDAALTAGVTRVRLVHLLELRRALSAAYAASGRAAPDWIDPAPASGATPIKAAHLTELRSAVKELE